MWLAGHLSRCKVLSQAREASARATTRGCSCRGLAGTLVQLAEALASRPVVPTVALAAFALAALLRARLRCGNPLTRCRISWSSTSRFLCFMFLCLPSLIAFALAAPSVCASGAKRKSSAVLNAVSCHSVHLLERAVDQGRHVCKSVKQPHRVDSLLCFPCSAAAGSAVGTADAGTAGAAAAGRCRALLDGAAPCVAAGGVPGDGRRAGDAAAAGHDARGGGPGGPPAQPQAEASR